MDRTLEKIALMREIGMTKRLEAMEEISLLTSLRFKPITLEEIRKKLRVKYKPKTFWKALYDAIFFDYPASVLVACIPIVGQLHVLADALANSKKRDSYWSRMSLFDWERDIPYGALLAVKEAMEKGVTEFEIYYPVTQESVMLRADPIITGYIGKPGSHTMVEVFAWDDGKVYE